MLSGLQAAGGDTARYALDNKLVDELASRTAIENQLVKAFGWDKQANDFNATSIYDYQPKPDANRGGKIAVVFANGAIMDGPQTPVTSGAIPPPPSCASAPGSGHQSRGVPRQQPGRQRQRIRSDPLRTGRRARRRQAGGGLDGRHGASGGYWVSTPADYIIASPSTLTGSIGIFGIINTYEKTPDTLGVHTDGVATSPLADIAVTKALPQEFSQMMQLNIENGYKNFLDLVAKSRKMTRSRLTKSRKATSGSAATPRLTARSINWAISTTR